MSVDMYPVEDDTESFPYPPLDADLAEVLAEIPWRF